MSDRDSMEFDVVIVGAGPSGLSAAIELKKLSPQANICIVEKGSEVGAHILSGAVIETDPLDELIPDWRDKGAPINTAVTKDEFIFLTKNSSFKLPTPKQMHNKGNYIISLGNLCRWLAEQATNLGIEIYPGFAANEILIENDQVVGIATGDMGIDKEGQQKASYQRGVELRGKYTLFAEGCRGSLTQDLFTKFDLRKNAAAQTYGIGLKEIWQVTSKQHTPGKVTHTVGWPMDNSSYGGSFIYHLDDNIVALGFVVGLDYQNPHLSPYQEFQRFKTHKAIKPLLEGGKRLSYGARALNEGGYQSIPDVVFPGGAIIGCAAGFLNVAKIKGTHNAIKSGMLAAKSIHEKLQNQDSSATLDNYSTALKNSLIYKELYQIRNIRPAFAKFGLIGGLIYAAIDSYILRGHAPWTFTHHTDHSRLKPAEDCPKIDYPKPDNSITFDRLTSVQLSNTNHEEDQPVHLKLKDESRALENLAQYNGPEQLYCPAGVYEFVESEGQPKLQINAQNCIHCKTCDIKDPTQNIKWTTPEGSGGPNYSDM